MAKFSLEKSPGHLLRRAQQYSYDLYVKEVGKTGPTPRQFAVLYTVSEDEGLSQTDLVRKTGIDRSTLADMISRLIKKGYLARQRTKADARANAVKLTATGRRVLKSAEAKVLKAEEATLSLLPKTQQSALVKALAIYAAALDKIDAEAMAPKKRAARKASAKKTSAKKVTGKKPAAKKATGKKVVAKKATKSAAKKAPAKKAVTKKTTTKKTTASKPASRKKAVKKTKRATKK